MSISQPQQRKPGPLSLPLAISSKVPGCVICDQAFDVTNKPSDTSHPDIKLRNVTLHANQVLATQCGHLYHLRCLEGALVHEKISLADRNLPNRRTCPNSECRKDLSTTKLIKVFLKGVLPDPENGSLDGSHVAEIKRLQTENAQLRSQLQVLQDKDMTRVGEKVFVQNTNGTYTGATVLELMVKVQKDNEPSNSKQEPTRTGSFRGKFSTLMRDQIVPVSRVILSRHFGRLSRNNEMKALWSAGERIFIRSERKEVTIKWIGSRNQAFMALLEYDEPISQEILSDVELPCSPKPYHCKLVYLNELNLMAEKIREPETSRSPISRFFRSSPLRRSAHP